MPTVAKSFEAHGPFIHKTEKAALALRRLRRDLRAILPGHLPRRIRDRPLRPHADDRRGVVIIEAVLEALSKRFRSSPARIGSWCAGDAGNHFRPRDHPDALLGRFRQGECGAPPKYRRGDRRLRAADRRAFGRPQRRLGFAVRPVGGDAGRRARDDEPHQDRCGGLGRDGTQCRPDYRCDGRTGKIDRPDRPAERQQAGAVACLFERRDVDGGVARSRASGRAEWSR